MPETKKAELERLDLRNRKEWRRWLNENGSSSTGVRLILYKKHSGSDRLAYEDSVEEALCFGWIDSRLNSLDGERFLLHFAPRKPKSLWSQRNKRRVKKLISAGLMTDAGMKKVEAARIDGSWNTLNAVDRLKVPADLKEALSANRNAVKNFQGLSNSSKKAFLFWIVSAKRPETRLARIRKTVFLAERNIKGNRYRP
jgi:uncharacterized protein YdeI (YjbR/CyaY-like superfamily)